MADYRCMFSTSGRHRKFNQLRWQNLSAHLTNETSYWLKKLLMHLNRAVYNVCDLDIDPHVCFFPTLSQDRARPIPLSQPEACPQRSERPVCARSPHRSRNGYPGWSPWYWRMWVYMSYEFYKGRYYILSKTEYRKLLSGIDVELCMLRFNSPLI